MEKLNVISYHERKKVLRDLLAHKSVYHEGRSVKLSIIINESIEFIVKKEFVAKDCREYSEYCRTNHIDGIFSVMEIYVRKLEFNSASQLACKKKKNPCFEKN